MSDDEGRLLIDDNSDDSHTIQPIQTPTSKQFSQASHKMDQDNVPNENIPAIKDEDDHEEGEISMDDEKEVQNDSANVHSGKRRHSSLRAELRMKSVSPSKISNGLVENYDVEQKYVINSKNSTVTENGERRSTCDQSTCVDWQMDLTDVASLMQLESGSKAFVIMNVVCKVQPNTIYVTMEIQGKEYYGIITEGEPPNVSQYLKKRNAAKNMLQEEDRERGGANTPTKKTSIGGTPKESAKRGPRFESRRKISRRNSENGDEDESDSEPAKKIHLREFDDRNDFHMCPHHGCNYKYRIPDQLEYHIAHSHTNKSKMYEDVATQTNVTGKCDKETNTVEILPSPSKTAIMNSLKSPTQFSDISDDTAAPELDKEGSFMNESSSSKRAASAMSMSNMTSTPIKKLQDNSPSKMDDPMQSARIAQGMPHSASTPILPSTAAMQMQGPGLSTLCSPPNLLVPSPFLGFPPSTFAMSQPRSSSASALHQAHKIHELRTNDASTSSSTDSPLPSSSNSTPSTSNQPPKQQSHQAQPQSRSSSAVPPSTSQPFPVPVMSSPTGPMAAPYFHPQHLLVRQGATTVTNSNIAPQLPFTMPVGTQQNQTEMAQFMAAMKHHGFYNPMFPK